MATLYDYCKEKNKEYLLQEWDYELNKDFDIKTILTGSHTIVWWKCSKCGYKWQIAIRNRVNGSHCPCCINKVAVEGINDLTTTHPEIAKEWHPTKNETLTAKDITYGSNKKVWWICPQGHEYKATIGHRTSENGTNCPICNSGRQTSFAEQAVYYYVKKLYPDAINRYKAEFLGRMELDVFIPSINYAIEYDGEAWHKGPIKLKMEEKNTNFVNPKTLN